MKKISFLLALLCSGFVFAQTTISTNITTNTSWTIGGSPYTVTTNGITVDSAAILTIDPGVEVRFVAGVEMYVAGKMIALGTPTDSIRFVGGSSNPATRSNLIGILGEVELAYCHFSWMSNPIIAYDFSWIPSLSVGPVGTIEHCHFEHNYSGVHFTRLPAGPTRLWVDSCSFAQNSFAGIVADQAEITNCTVSDSKYGMAVSVNSKVDHCILFNNEWAIRTNPIIEISHCEIYSNFGGITLSSAGLGGLSGISTIANNRIEGNQIGFSYRYDTIPVTNYPPIQFWGNVICNDSMNVTNIGRLNFVYPDLDMRQNCWCQWDSAGVDSTIGNSLTQHILLMPMDSSCLPRLVFPGDANHDQIVNNQDLLPIGIHFGQTGATRANPSNSWIGQRADDWNLTQANGRDVKHADCNGDGTVNGSDTLAINQNYGLTHNSWRDVNGGTTQIRFDMPTSQLNPGDTVHIPIELGTVDTMASNIYGIAFSIQYDKMLIDSASVRVDYTSSWLGTKNVDLLTLDKDFFDQGQLDLALVRTNQQNRSGFGMIADLIVVISDDLAKREIPFPLNLRVGKNSQKS